MFDLIKILLYGFAFPKELNVTYECGVCQDDSLDDKFIKSVTISGFSLRTTITVAFKLDGNMNVYRETRRK